MKVFVSSVITGFEKERAAVREAIITLGHEPIMAEDFGAQPRSPQVACLQHLRESDLVILVLGERYGPPQASGLSATHEEYLEARDSKHLLAFVCEDMTAEPKQAALIAKVEQWAGGLLRHGYRSMTDCGRRSRVKSINSKSQQLLLQRTWKS